MIAFSRRALQLLSREVRGLHAAFYVLAASALLSSLLALLRDRLFAHIFGASATLDIYYASFSFPDLIFVGTGALVSVYILIPELARRTSAQQHSYIDSVIVGFCAFAVLIGVSAFVLTPLILTVFFPQLAAKHLAELELLTRIMLLQPIFLGLSNILAAITQSRHRYWLYSASPILYNSGIIFGALVLYPMWGIYGLAWGVVVGSLLHAGVQIPSIIADGFFRRIPRLGDPRIFLGTIGVSVPRALALTMTQLTFFGLKALAGLLATGSIAIFMFAYNLQAVPLAIVGASYSVAAFPMLAAAFSKGELEHFVENISIAARYVLFWSLPIMALVIVLRAYIVRIILGTGNFDWTDTRLTAAALALFAVALPAQGITLLLVRGYYAAGKTFTPFFVALLSAISTIALGALAVGALSYKGVASVTDILLRVAGVPGSTVLALCFAYALVALLGAVVLMVHFDRYFSGLWPRIRRTLSESALSAIGGGLVAYVVLELAGPISLSSTTLSVLLRGALGGICGAVAAGAISYFLGSKEFAEVSAGIRARLWYRADIPTEAVASAEEASPSIS